MERTWLLDKIADAFIAALRSVVAQNSVTDLVHGLDSSDLSAQMTALSRQLIQLTTPVAATRSLPRDVPTYTGRRSELDRLIRAATNSVAFGGVVGIHAIDGMAGVGKTALAIHAAHKLAGWFPDGQVFIPLHAHTPGQQPVDPSEALATLLLTVGVPAEQIPAGVEARSALWRHYLKDKRLLLVADDAAGSEQVRPLLPGAERCLVLVTSRRRLTALEAGDSISLDILSPDEAAELFIRIAGRSDLDATHSDVSEVVQLCGRLPLAVRMAAAQLSCHPTWKIGNLSAALAAEHNLSLAISAENVTVAATFDLSYRHLTSHQQKLFCRLGLQFGIDIDDYAAAVLVDTDLPTARQLLNDLYNYHLIDELTFGRYRFHDLMREYAQSKASAEESAARDAAIMRLLEYYLGTATNAGRELAWNTPEVSPLTAQVPACMPEMQTREQKVIWLEAERANLHAAAEYAVRKGLLTYAIGIPFAMHGFLRTNGYWNQAVSLHRAALITAQHAHDQRGQASALCQLGAVQRLTGDYQAATTSQARALDLYRELGDRTGETDALIELGTVHCLTDEYTAATETLNEALRLTRIRGDRFGEADALCELGVVQRLTGNYQVALTSLTQALERYREVEDCLGEADSFRNLGAVQQLTRDYQAALASLTHALELYRYLASRPGQADALRNIGIVQHLTQDHVAATASLIQALDLYRDVGDRHGEIEALNDLGELMPDSISISEARHYHELALTAAQTINAQLEQARALEGLGRCDLRAGYTEQGAKHLKQALVIYWEIGSPNATRVQAILRSLI
jgi:tetratricopeptide (TPR) repeat protein